MGAVGTGSSEESCESTEVTFVCILEDEVIGCVWSVYLALKVSISGGKSEVDGVVVVVVGRGTETRLAAGCAGTVAVLIAEGASAGAS